MIDEENVNQTIFEYADKKYGRQSKELFQRYINEFPEKDWELPDETWRNNFRDRSKVFDFKGFFIK